jgi:hypothetical protein
MNLDPADQALNLAAEAAVTSNEESSRADGKMMERSGSKALLVLGMHRSGTSSIAGAMVLLGGCSSQFDATHGRQSERLLGIHSPYDVE